MMLLSRRDVLRFVTVAATTACASAPSRPADSRAPNVSLATVTLHISGMT